MSFVDTLRSARTSRVAVLHEFWTQYAPADARAHLFFEGHEDGVFYTDMVRRAAPPETRIYTYRCDGKAKVYDAFQDIVQRAPSARTVFFFVDKDLDDVVGASWPTDPRIFVTDVYSIENYLVTANAASKLASSIIRLTGVSFDHSALVAQFQHELDAFYRRVLPVMGWILTARRAGRRPNLASVDLARICSISNSCQFGVRRGARVQYLEQTTGVSLGQAAFRKVAAAVRELARIQPKRVVRGKFEAWFFVAFWKQYVSNVRSLAVEAGGTCRIAPTLEMSTFVNALVPHIDPPDSLARYLTAHFPSRSVVPSVDSGSRRVTWFARLVSRLFGRP
jgi:hypothetical protein